MTEKIRKPCQRCGHRDAIYTEKYCYCCRPLVLREMEAAGYFTPIPKRTVQRPAFACEDEYETRFGPRDFDQ